MENQIIKRKKKFGFTLAEVLIALLIIGVVAALVMPIVSNSVESVRWHVSQQRAVYNIREAIGSMYADLGKLNGIGDNVAFRDKLSKYISMIKTCDTVTDCFPATIKDISGNVATPSSGTVGAILSNGTSFNIKYNTACTKNELIDSSIGQDHICVNIIYDTNGFARPNQIGKDIGFVSVIDPVNAEVVGPIPDTEDISIDWSATWNTAPSYCTARGKDYYVPTKDELNSIYYNKGIIGNMHNSWHFWSSSDSTSDPSTAWGQCFSTGGQWRDPKGAGYLLRCVKK